MGELNQLMLEHEEFLESSLDDMEFGGELSQEQVDCIRQACGKPRNSQVNPVLRDVINDFGNIFGNPLASFPTIRGEK
tara:strand:+ start:1137 stop:1370 length:234 start_codon:yes stop_codon:yes gene_type:complete